MENYTTIDYLLNPNNPEISDSIASGSLDFLTSNSRTITADFKRKLYLKIKHLEAKLHLANDPVVALMQKKLEFLETRGKGVKPYWIWMTVRPQQGTNFSDFQRLTEDLLRRKHVAEYLYVYEQVGESYKELGKGFHFHLLIRTTPDRPKPCKMSKNLKNTFKRICNINTGACQVITKCPSQFVKDKIQYMIGKKTGLGKDVKQVSDTLWRNSLKLKKYYSSKDFLSNYNV